MNKEELITIYYFLNNTKGYIEEFEIKYLYEITDNYFDKEKVKEYKDVLDKYIESGNKEEQFVDYFIKKEV